MISAFVELPEPVKYLDGLLIFLIYDRTVIVN